MIAYVDICRFGFIAAAASSSVSLLLLKTRDDKSDQIGIAQITDIAHRNTIFKSFFEIDIINSVNGGNFWLKVTASRFLLQLISYLDYFLKFTVVNA